MFKVYKITNKINGKFYIGYTKLTLEARWKLHISNNSPNMLIAHAIRKYGPENFDIELIEQFEIKQHATAHEIHLIETLNPPYNIHQGGTGGAMIGSMNGMYGRKYTDEEKLKMSISRRGELNHFYGKRHTEETKKKMSELKKERYIGEGNPAHGKKRPDLSERNKLGHSPETRSKMSEQRKGRCWIMKGSASKLIDPCEFETYLQEGWVRGRLGPSPSTRERISRSLKNHRADSAG